MRLVGFAGAQDRGLGERLLAASRELSQVGYRHLLACWSLPRSPNARESLQVIR